MLFLYGCNVKTGGRGCIPGNTIFRGETVGHRRTGNLRLFEFAALSNGWTRGIAAVLLSTGGECLPRLGETVDCVCWGDFDRFSPLYLMGTG